MYSSDKSGLSDPYAIMSFGRYSTRSRVIKESVCPTWDQTMLINQIRIFGDPESVLETPPPVIVEFYDRDIVVSYCCDDPLPNASLFTVALFTNYCYPSLHTHTHRALMNSWASLWPPLQSDSHWTRPLLVWIG